MTCFFSLPISRFFLFAGFIVLLSACAPATNMAPSGALKQQLADIKQQQLEQATQLQQLQQQLDQLNNRFGTGTTDSGAVAKSADNKTVVIPAPVPLPANQQAVNQEVVNIAASASSYLAAFSNLAAGNAVAAETGFTNFLAEFPDHQYAPNARLWLAKAQQSQGKTNLAIGNLNQIISDPNSQTKAPAALVQLAQIYRQEGLTTQADNVLEQLRNRYPDSPEAQQINRSNEPKN